MKKNLILMSLVLAGLAIPSAAKAFYVGGSFGGSNAKADGVDFDSGEGSAFSIYAGFGIPLPLIPIRAEVEYFNLKSTEDTIGDIKTSGAAANAYIGLPLLPILKPYVGFGLGYMKQDIDGLSESSDWKVVPQYMIGADLDLPLIPVAGGVEYRYISTDFENSAVSGGKYDSDIHSFLVKARYKF